MYEKRDGTAVALPSGQLEGQVVRPQELSDEQKARMAALLDQFFENVSPAQFTQDLREKEWVVVLRDGGNGEIQGFSTLMHMRVEVDGHDVVAFFSGDTIIHPDYWQESGLPRIWGQHVFSLADTIEEDAYWFLLSSGYKTYRFLPVFFREFYPGCHRPTPPGIKQIIDTLATRKFGDEYDAATGVIRFAEAAPLRAGVAEVTSRRIKDPDIAFFVHANPGYHRGDQLACLVKLDRENVTPAGLRMLGAG